MTKLEIYTVLVLFVFAGCCQGDFEFEGCFSQIADDMSDAFIFRDNINIDCAYHCSQRGYILAATRNSTCVCTQVYPGVLLAAPVYPNSTGVDGPCSYTCPGVHVDSDCTGDECCGGPDGALSVWTTGKINLDRELELRLRRSLKRLPWVEPIFQESCSHEFIETRVMYGDVVLEIGNHEYRPGQNCNSAQTCKEQCANVTTCRSVTYLPQTRRCYLNFISSVDARTYPSSSGDESLIFDRNCTANVNVSSEWTPEMQLVNLESMVTHEGNHQDLMPLGDLDFELDLTNSNQGDTIKRTISVENTEQAILQTSSGFENIDVTSESSSTYTRHKSYRRYRHVYTRAGKAGGSARACFLFFCVGGSRGYKWSRTSDSTRSTLTDTRQYSSQSSSNTQTTFVNTGNTEIYKSKDTKSYEYSLTVPPFHKGYINFFEANYDLIYKWRATYKLNGDIVVMHPNGYHQRIHVSRLLSDKERTFYTAGSLVLQRRKVVGKTTILDGDGNIVQQN